MAQGHVLENAKNMAEKQSACTEEKSKSVITESIFAKRFCGDTTAKSERQKAPEEPARQIEQNAESSSESRKDGKPDSPEEQIDRSGGSPFPHTAEKAAQGNRKGL